MLNQNQKDLVSSSLGLTVFLAKKHISKNHPHFSDLVQEGYIGLIRGVEKYDPGRGFCLSTYVSKCILTRFYNHGARLALWPAISLDDPLPDDEHTLIDFIEDEGPPPDDLAAEDEVKALVRLAINMLPVRQREIILLHYGFRGREYTLQEIGQRLGLSKQRIHIIMQGGHQRLREILAPYYTDSQ